MAREDTIQTSALNFQIGNSIQKIIQLNSFIHLIVASKAFNVESYNDVLHVQYRVPR